MFHYNDQDKLMEWGRNVWSGHMVTAVASNKIEII